VGPACRWCCCARPAKLDVLPTPPLIDHDPSALLRTVLDSVRLHHRRTRCAFRRSTTGRTDVFSSLGKVSRRQEYPGEKIASVPTAAQRNGDFSDTRDNSNRLITIYDPLTGRADSTGKWIRSPFEGNVIPKERFNPVALKILALYPSPNTVSAGRRRADNFYSANNIANSISQRHDPA